MPGEIQTGARTPRQDNRRVQLLDAAARLFNQRGYHATSMRDIAKAVDMLSGSIYYHFNSKQEMLLAVYAEGARRIGISVDAAVARETFSQTRLNNSHLPTSDPGRSNSRLRRRTSPRRQRARAITNSAVYLSPSISGSTQM